MDPKIDQKWNSASLRIVSKTITPAGITKTLGIEPTCVYAIGIPVHKSNPSSKIAQRCEARSNLRQESSWILESGLDESEPLNLHISKLLLLIESKVERFKELLSVCDIEIFCGFSSAPASRRCANRKWSRGICA